MPEPSWYVIVPVKPTVHAKSRLGAEYGDWRPALAHAFAIDTITAACASDLVERVVVVTSDAVLAEEVSGPAKVTTVDDHGHGDLNAAIEAALSAVPEDAHVAALTADLPALTSPILTAALTAAARHDAAFVPDREGTGTTMLSGTNPAHLHPRFGARSCHAHLATGAVQLLVDEMSPLRRDVDTPEQLRQAQALGVGCATRRVLNERNNGTGPVWGPVPS